MKAFPIAFPIHSKDPYQYDWGMDLRDYFAAKAMQGLVGRSGRNFSLSDVVDCYLIADEMIKERSKHDK